MTSDWEDEDVDNFLDWDDNETPSDEQPELTLPGADQEPAVLAALPDGSGTLIISGPGAGTAVVPNTGDHEKSTGGPISSALATRDQALAPGKPLLLVHKPHQGAKNIPRLLAGIFAATQGSVGLGATVNLPSATQKSHNEWLDSCRAASVKIADPAGYQLDQNHLKIKEISDRARRYMPYLSADPLDVDEVLDAQRGAGATLLLSPGRALDASDPQLSLDASFATADKALTSLAAGERLGLNLTMSGQWLSKPNLREMLFDQLMDQQQFDIWFIRVQWPSKINAYQQPQDLELLQGYKRLSQMAQDEDRVLLLPQTGLHGWLQLAFGATGFGAGPFGAAHAFKETIQGGNGHQDPVSRYFEPSLLHTVERTVHEALSKTSGYVACDCPYCPGLLASSSQEWNHELARLHHLHWLGRLAGLQQSTGRALPAAIRRTVRNANRSAADRPLAGISLPQHLPVWDQLL
jgi:hypothetical protein